MPSMQEVMRQLAEMHKRDALVEEQHKAVVAQLREALAAATGAPQEETGGEQPPATETTQEGATVAKPRTERSCANWQRCASATRSWRSNTRQRWRGSGRLLQRQRARPREDGRKATIGDRNNTGGSHGGEATDRESHKHSALDPLTSAQQGGARKPTTTPAQQGRGQESEATAGSGRTPR